MKIRVRRDTGLLGSLTGDMLKVNGRKIKQLYREEEHVVFVTEDQTVIQVNQWFFGSLTLTVNNDATVIVKTNYNCVALYLMTFIFLFISSYSSLGLLKVVFS